MQEKPKHVHTGEGRGIPLRVSHIIVAVASVALTALGFAVGVVFSDGGVSSGVASRPEGVDVEISEVSGGSEVTAPPADTPSLPESDVEGAEIEGLPRYPGSVRIEYIREDQGGIVWTEAEYMTTATLEDVRLYYRDIFREGEWSVNDVSFSQEAWIFFIVSGEREVFVNLRPRGDFVEVDIEHTEPDETESTRETTAQQEAPQQEAPQQETPQQAPAVQEPVYQEPVYQEPVYEEPVYQEPAPVYDDDDAYEGYDDGYDGDD